MIIRKRKYYGFFGNLFIGLMWLWLLALLAIGLLFLFNYYSDTLSIIYIIMGLDYGMYITIGGMVGISLIIWLIILWLQNRHGEKHATK